MRSNLKSQSPMGAQIGYQGIARLLRERIVKGRWQAGQRLPTHRELEEEFRTSSVTVQNALNLLQKHEFVRTAGRQGSFVTDHPPHLYTYGIVFPPIETRYFNALRSAARVVFNSGSRRLRVYESVANQPAHPKNLKVLDDVAHHRVAGLVMTWACHEFLDSLLYNPKCDVPRVSLHDPTVRSGMPLVILDYEAFFDRAVERLAAEGRRKIACIGIGSDGAPFVESHAALKRRGLEIRRYWHLSVAPNCYPAARTGTHLLMSLAPADRPDAFIIADDNLTEHAQAGLIDAGINVPQDLSIITHCNWPEPPVSIFPMTRLGFDITAMMRTCADLIDHQRRGMTPPERVIVKPLSEEEINVESDPGSSTAHLTNIPASMAGVE
jgi:DNA-binding LacI/PurR family transcriptional regulator